MRAEQPEPSAVLAVGAVVLDGSGRVLLVRRGRPPGAGTWTLPGGRVQGGESLEAAIVREVREETALEARVVCPLGVATIAIEGRVYAIHEHLLVSSERGPAEPVAGDDAADAAWVGRSDLERLGVTPEVTSLVDRAFVEASRLGTDAP